MTTTAIPSGPRKALGRGLESLIPTAKAVEHSQPPTPAGTRLLPTSEIDPNPYQTRLRFEETALTELAESIKANGLVQPIVVRPANGRFQLIAGERRWRAAKKAGLEFIPAVVKQVSNEQAMEITIVENLQREDLNPMEQARAFDRLAREFNLTQEQISAKTGKDRTAIGHFLRLLRLPESVQTLVENDDLSMGHAKVLLMLDDPQAIATAVQKIRGASLSVRQTEELVHRMLSPFESSKEGDSAKTKPALDPNVRAAQEQLQRVLGMRVTIRDKKGKGKIVIEYASLEDFDRVVEALRE